MNRTNHQTNKTDVYYRDFVKKQVGDVISPSTPPGSPRRGPRTPRSPMAMQQPLSPFKLSPPASPSRGRTSSNSQKKEADQSSPRSPLQTQIQTQAGPSSSKKNGRHFFSNVSDSKFLSCIQYPIMY